VVEELLGTRPTFYDPLSDKFSKPTLTGKTPRQGRKKRGLIADITGEVIKQSIGAFTGSIVSNLISTIIEKINPHSNTNRIKRLGSSMEEIKNNFDIQKQFNHEVLNHLQDLANSVENLYRQQVEFRNDFPQYVWITALIVNKIGSLGLLLQEVISHIKKRSMATSALAGLKDLNFLSEIPPERSRFLSVSKINSNSFNIKFVANLEDLDTRVYKTYGFDHWDNLDDVPRLLKYVGATLLIYNESTNCIKTLTDEPVSNVIGEKCDELDGTDPALNQWEVSVSTFDLEQYSNRSVMCGRRQELISNDVMSSQHPQDMYAEYSQVVRDRMRTDAIATQQDAQEASRSYFERRHRPETFIIGDLVLARITGRRGKLQNRYAGPYRITKAEKDIYTLEAITGRKEILQRHVSDLKRYTERGKDKHVEHPQSNGLRDIRGGPSGNATVFFVSKNFVLRCILVQLGKQV